MNKNILWLASWYPSVLAPFDGDFIQRHAKAVSILTNITVIHIKKDVNGTITKNIKKEETRTGKLTEIVVYYHCFKTGLYTFDKIFSLIKYKSVYRSVIKKYITSNGLPAIVHVHIALKAGLQALWLKKKFAVPFILSEHWSGFLPENRAGVISLNSLQKNILKKIIRQAEQVTVVSETLGKQLANFCAVEYKVLPNTVDTNIFYPVEKTQNQISKFIHASSLNPEKNIVEIIEAFYHVKNKGFNFQLMIYGPENLQVKQLVTNKNLDHHIILKKETPQHILAQDMRQADALVLYSRYETFGCVVIEANACGIPAILSDLPVFREYIIENKTGIFAKPNDPENLTDTIINFIKKSNSFSQTEIATYTKNKFSYEVVAKQFDELYKSLIK